MSQPDGKAVAGRDMMRAVSHPQGIAMRSTDLRQRLARESARLMAQECIADFQTAKAKAAARLGVPLRHLPSNSEIEQALAEYQRLFHADSLPGRLRELRLAALQAMHLFKDFNPRLAGPVLSGNIHPHSEIVLHLFTDTPEEIAWFLMERHIPYQLKEHLYQAGPERCQRESYPCYRFMAGQESIALEIFPVDGIRRAPPSPVDGKPMRRADRQALENLLAGDGGKEPAGNAVDKGVAVPPRTGMRKSVVS